MNDDLMEFARKLGRQAADEDWQKIKAQLDKLSPEEVMPTMAKLVQTIPASWLTGWLSKLPADVLLWGVARHMRTMPEDMLAEWLDDIAGHWAAADTE